MPEPKKQVNFFWIAAGIILLTALVITLHWPEITAWRQHKVDVLLRSAKEQKTAEARYSYLQQASLIDSHDPLATEAMAQFWLDRGETDKAIAAYQQGIDNPNYVYLGNLALQNQNYPLALQYFKNANGVDSTTSGLVGEAAADFNLNNITDGCNKALQASKSDLSSEQAKNLLKSCILLGGNNTEAAQLVGQSQPSSREVAYILLSSKVYQQAEQKLNSLEEKGTGDYLVLARLAAARGDITTATKLAEQGIELDKANIELNKALVQYYTILGDNTKKDLYQNRLDQLLFLQQIK